MDTVYSKDFILTHSIEKAVKNALDDIRSLIQGIHNIRISVRKEGRHQYNIQVALIYLGLPINVSSNSKEFYKGVRNAKAKIIRRVNRIKRKKRDNQFRSDRNRVRDGL